MFWVGVLVAGMLPVNKPYRVGCFAGGHKKRREDPIGDSRPAVANNRIEFLRTFILISDETGSVVSKRHGSRNDRHAEPLLACSFWPIAQPPSSLVVLGPLGRVESKQNHLGAGVKFQNASN